MPVFEVTIERAGYGYTTLLISAENELAAQEQALELAGDLTYTEKHSDYEINAIKERKQ